MKFLIIGGTGLIGTKLINNLRQQGHEAVAASPSRGVNSVTGEGLAQAMKGMQIIVDVSNSPSFEDKAVLDFFEASTRNLLAAGAAAGVGNYVALSVVGADRLPASGYLRAKAAQEKLIKASAIPFTIARATQFMEFIGSIANSATKGQEIYLPSALMQPIFSSDVAAALADIVVAKPLRGTIELAGPEAIPLDEIVRQYLKANRDARKVITDNQAPYFGTPLKERSLLPDGNARIGPTHFKEWLQRSVATAK